MTFAAGVGTYLARDPALRAEIQGAVDDANKAVSQAEAIKKFALLGEEFTEAGGQLTPTLKVRREIIMRIRSCGRTKGPPAAAQ